jgi:hypothetical protein
MGLDGVCILDKDPGRSQLFSDFLKKEGIDTIVVDNIERFATSSFGQDFMMILIDYLTILKARRDAVLDFFKRLSSGNMIVYNVPADATRRLAFYDLGARWVFDVTYDQDEIVYNIKSVLKKITAESNPQKLASKGKLKNTSVASLINKIGRENRSGVLKIATTANSGKIYFYNGDVDDAQVGSIKGQEAVFHMYLWRKGDFIFTVSHPESRLNNIELSNIGILIRAEEIRREYLKSFESLCSPHSIIAAKNIGDLVLSFPDIPSGFFKLLSKPTVVEELLENSYFTNYRSLAILLELKEGNVLKIEEPVKAVLETIQKNDSGLKEMLLNKEELDRFKENIGIEDETSIKMLFLGAKEGGRSKIIRDLSHTQGKMKGKSQLELAHVQLDKNLELLIVGAEMNQMIMDSIEQISEGLSGYVFLIDCSKTEDFEYNNYFINHLLSINHVPVCIVLMNFSENENVDTIRSHFLIPEGIPWVIYNPDDAGSAKEIVLSITPIPEEEEAEEDKNDAAAEEETEKDNYSDIALEETEDNTEKVEGEREE